MYIYMSVVNCNKGKVYKISLAVLVTHIPSFMLLNVKINESLDEPYE